MLFEFNNDSGSTIESESVGHGQENSRQRQSKDVESNSAEIMSIHVISYFKFTLRLPLDKQKTYFLHYFCLLIVGEGSFSLAFDSLKQRLTFRWCCTWEFSYDHGQTQSLRGWRFIWKTLFWVHLQNAL